VRRREFIALIGSDAGVSLVPVPVARAQEPGRIYKLGVIAGPGRQVPRIVAFFDELKELGAIPPASAFSRPNSMASGRKSSWRPCPARGVSHS
jgi:hypothetical protein